MNLHVLLNMAGLTCLAILPALGCQEVIIACAADGIDAAGVELAQGRGGVAGADDFGDVGVAVQQVGEFVECGRFVVHGENGQQPGSRPAHWLGHWLPTPNAPPLAHTPDRNFGTRITTFVPAPIAVSTTRP